MVECMRPNITLMKWMIAEGYADARVIPLAVLKKKRQRDGVAAFLR